MEGRGYNQTVDDISLKATAYRLFVHDEQYMSDKKQLIYSFLAPDIKRHIGRFPREDQFRTATHDVAGKEPRIKYTRQYLPKH